MSLKNPFVFISWLFWVFSNSKGKLTHTQLQGNSTTLKVLIVPDYPPLGRIAVTVWRVWKVAWEKLTGHNQREQVTGARKTLKTSVRMVREWAQASIYLKGVWGWHKARASLPGAEGLVAQRQRLLGERTSLMGASIFQTNPTKPACSRP